MGLPKNRRIRRPEEFRRVLKNGNRARDKLLLMTAASAENSQRETRYGFAVSKRVGNAVIRNRVKRRLRSITASMQSSNGWDIFISAYPPTSEATCEQLAKSVTKLAKRLRVIPQEQQPTETSSRSFQC